MRALLLAAGLGTRLDPLTRYVPKCLMPLRGRPLLDIWLDKLSRIGVTEFIVNTHHHAEMVTEYVRRSPFAAQVQLAHEPVLLGTSGTIREHAAFLATADSLVLHADNLCDDDLVGLIQAHRSRPVECVMTLLTFRAAEPSSCGIIETDSQGVMAALHHKVAHPPSDVANAATYVFTPELIEEVLAAPGAWDFSSDTLPLLVGRALTHHTEMPFVDIGTIPAYLEAATDGTVWAGRSPLT